MSKIVYLFDPSSRAFTGVYEAQESPAEPGEFITPVYSTEVTPPALLAGQWAYLNSDDIWIVRDNPIQTDAGLLDAEIDRYRMAVRQHMSAVAKASPEHFNSISEAKSFVGTDNPLAVVSAAFQIWAADVQTAANAVIDSGDPLPTIDELIASLPGWEHP